MHWIASGRNSFAVTNADVGFPGNAKTSVFFIFANVVGLPGFILILPKNTYPCYCKNGLIKSSSPILTPPVVTIKSQFELNLLCSSSVESCTLPKSVTVHGNCANIIISIALFESLILPRGTSFASGDTSSFPVLKTPTLGCWYTLTESLPIVHSSPISAAFIC